MSSSPASPESDGKKRKILTARRSRRSEPATLEVRRAVDELKTIKLPQQRRSFIVQLAVALFVASVREASASNTLFLSLAGLWTPFFEEEDEKKNAVHALVEQSAEQLSKKNSVSTRELFDFVRTVTAALLRDKSGRPWADAVTPLILSTSAELKRQLGDAEEGGPVKDLLLRVCHKFLVERAVRLGIPFIIGAWTIH